MESKLQQQAPQKAQTYKPNLTGIPTQMKLDFERQSGLSFDDVRVHYNSDKPAQLQALAYTQGTQVYVGPGQERHLPHELRHIVQQKQGRVRANGIINNVPVNIETSLEREADTYIPKTFVTDQQNSLIEGIAPIQCRFRFCFRHVFGTGSSDQRGHLAAGLIGPVGQGLDLLDCFFWVLHYFLSFACVFRENRLQYG